MKKTNKLIDFNCDEPGCSNIITLKEEDSHPLLPMPAGWVRVHNSVTHPTGYDVFCSAHADKHVFDEVAWPVHYIKGREIEPIKVIEDWNLPHHLACVVKYICRYGRGKDDGVGGLKKALWYLDRFINLKREGR